MAKPTDGRLKRGFAEFEFPTQAIPMIPLIHHEDLVVIKCVEEDGRNDFLLAGFVCVHYKKTHS